LLATRYNGGQAQAYADFQTLTNVPEPAAAGMLAAAALAGGAILGCRHRSEI
jgi:hypothetical protein